MPVLGTSSGSTKGPSTAPTIGTATAGNAQATVTFTAPSFSKLPITSYTVTASPGGFTGAGASSPITVSGLSNGTSYTFTVTAASANGISSSSGSSNSANPVRVYSIGETGPGGGKVFYDAGSTLSWGRYLEAATNASSPAWNDSNYAWSGVTNVLVAGMSTGIGTGMTNTLAMVAQSGTANRAGTVCRAYTGGGFSNTSTGWFLPSKDELNQMYAYRGTIGGFVLDYDTSIYWCSYNTSSGGATAQRFYDGGQFDGNGKASPYKVRPIRAFS